MPLTPAQFLQLGYGKTAPWLDLVNSEEWDTYGRRTDYLNDPSWLAVFLKHWHFAAPRGKAFPLARFRALRAALRKSCERLLSGRSIAGKELRVINDALCVVGMRELFQRQNGLRLEFVPAAGGWAWILAQTALSFAEFLSHGEAARVKICANSDCRWVFYDTTKARTRRWCSDKVCGNRDRVRRSRARHAHQT
jgi:predicted RNA-binding Zn ribbon-like protein